LNNLIIISAVIIVAIFIGILGNSNYQEVAKVRDQRNLQLTLDDCKRLFDEGLNRVECFDKSINAFGTDEQKLQWESGYFDP
jgi:hypothetical protein